MTIEQPEKNTTLQSVRLNYLNLAGQMLAGGNYKQCFEYLENFKGTIREGNEAYADILKARKKCEDYENNMSNMYTNAYAGRYLESSDMQNNALPYVSHTALRMYYDSCWKIALQHQLV